MIDVNLWNTDILFHNKPLLIMMATLFSTVKMHLQELQKVQGDHEDP